MTDLYNERIDAMKAAEHDWWRSGGRLIGSVAYRASWAWENRQAIQNHRNAERLAAYHEKRRGCEMSYDPLPRSAHLTP